MKQTKYDWRSVYDLRTKKIYENLHKGQLFENGNKVKFEITEMNDTFVYLSELNPEGKLTEKKRKFLKESFVGLVNNKHFGETSFGHKEVYADMRKYEIGLLYKK